MALFGLFSRNDKKKPEAPPPKPVEELSKYTGMRVEVADETAELIMIGRLVIMGTVMELQELTGLGGLSAASKEQPAAAEGENAEDGEEPAQKHVKLRGFDQEQQKAIHMEGDILPLDGHIWRLWNLRVMGKDNDRAFFRQATTATGEVQRYDTEGADLPFDCSLVNISEGGVCIATTAAFGVDDHLVLKTQLLPNVSAASLPCMVRRVTAKRGGIYEYGSQFVGINDTVQNQLAKSIIELQMKRMKR